MFPVTSETFILRQITGMIDRGHEVDIYAGTRAQGQPVHPEVGHYGLLERTRFATPAPERRVRRVIGAAGLLMANQAWRRASVVLRALNVPRYGRAAASLSLLYAAVPLARRPPYDVLHCQFGPEGPPVLALRQIGALTGKLVTSFRGYDVPPRPTAGRRRPYDELFREGDLFLPVSASLAARLVEAGCDPGKIQVLHSGIDLRHLAFAERQPPGDGEPIRIVTVARLVEKKGVAYAIQAVARLLAAGRCVTYTVVGEGGLRGELERLIAELGVGAHMRLLGWRNQDEVVRLCRDAHLMVAPSITAANGDQEGIPNAVKEAMALGLPVVATRHSGIPELVEDGVSGLLVPERDVDALADRLTYLIDHGDAWGTMAQAGRARVETDFDIETLNDRLERLYRT
jgi:colanic acid/amylovoran biosynthesis glycosyltransferase